MGEEKNSCFRVQFNNKLKVGLVFKEPFQHH